MKTDADKLRSFLKQVAPTLEIYGKKSIVSEIDKAITTTEDSATVLFCGEFKRGKSSLVNAIIGAELCPTDTGIATSVITTIKYGAVKKAVRYYGNILDAANAISPDSFKIGESPVPTLMESLKSEEIEWDDIQKYTMGDVLDIDNTVLVELSYPCPFLKNGITIIDTPGIGGLDPRHAILTHMALPKADVIVFVTDPAEPLTDSEKTFYIEHIQPINKPCVLLVNKCDILLSETLNIHLDKVKLEFADSICPQIIPTSAKYWELYTALEDEEFLQKSNKDAVLTGVISQVKASRKFQYKKIRDFIIAELNNASVAISNEIDALNQSSDEKQKELEELMRQQIALASYRKELETPTSQTRLQINSIFEDARNDVANLISTRGGELTSVEFNTLLASEKGLNNDGKWLVAQINDRLRQLSYDVDERIESAFKGISEKIQSDIADTVGSNMSLMTGDFKELNSFTSQLLFSTAGKAGLSLTVVSVLASGPIGWAVGLAAAVGLVWRSVSNENETRKKAEIQQQILPKINLALTDLRNQTNNRFAKFHQNLLSVLQTIIKDIEDRMKALQVSIQESRTNEHKNKELIAELEQKSKFCETITAQMKLLYSNPFTNAQ